MSISGSVGIRGNNRPEDVKKVQTLLNRNGVSPALREDGIAGNKTNNAIKWFQERIVKMRIPDGRVDPNGKTWRALQKQEGKRPEKKAPSPTSSNPSEKQEFRADRKKFVDPRVKETKVTTQIIDKIYPHFQGTNVKVISGYLSDSDLFWKVNYHWEYLLWMVDHSKTLAIEQRFVKELDSIKAALLGNSPKPASGYRTSASVGKPVDDTSAQVMTDRHKMLSQQKRNFKKITQDAGLMDKSTRSNKCFYLAYAPVAHPGTSKHSTGYAIDLSGSTGTIKSVTKKLGASLIFDEKSHVHVEFKNGVSNV